MNTTNGHQNNGLSTHPLAHGLAPEQAAIVSRVLAAEARPGAADPAELAKHYRNDTGNARRLIARHGGDLCYVETLGWLVWDGARWRADGGNAAALVRAQQTAEAIREEAAHAGCEATEKALQAFSSASGNQGRCTAMLAAAAPHLRVDQASLDGNPWLFSVENGTIDLAHGAGLFPHRRSDFITKRAGVAYDLEADCPRWERFIAEVLPEMAGEGVARFVQKWLGYCLCGDISEQKIVQFEGKGANGKSTLLEVLARLLGDYATVTPIETFLHKEHGRNGSGPSPDIARLPGARLVRASEPEPGARLSESVIKQWTGGEKMIARHLNRDFFEFTPTGKLTLSVNIRPVLVGKDHGIRRRILVVPFKQRFTPGQGAQRGATLVDELMREGPGILNWLLEGFALWREEGLEPPPEVAAATAEYFTEMDPIGTFVKEAITETGRREDRVPSTDIFGAYKRWCAANNEDEKTQTAFGRRLGDLGLKKHTLHGRVGYTGVVLDQAWAPPAAAANGQNEG